MGYNLVVRAWAAFLMYPCGSGLFRVVCVFCGDYFLSLIISFLVFLWDFVVEVGFGGGGACPFLIPRLMLLDLILVLRCGLGSFESVCVLVGVIFVVLM